jgi:penicillin-binding protein 2
LRERGIIWFPGETISVAIGQGPVLTSPLQIAVMMAAVANGGEVLRPRIVQSDQREVVDRVTVSPDTLAILHEALWAAVNDGGTAAASRVAGLNMAGKTGTAQVIRQEVAIDSDELPYRYRDHAWFASFAPRENPELVVVVFVEHGGHGSSAAAPLAKLLYERHFGPILDNLDT